MNKPARRPSQKRRPQQRKGRTAMAARGARVSNRTTWIIVLVVLAIGGGLLFAVASGNKTNSADDFVKGDKAAPASLVSKVTGVSDKVITTVGAGSIYGLPTKIPGKPLLTSDGKPRIIYMGAEYCPYCATERWAMLNAFSRFGKFTNVKITSSAKITPQGSPEVYPGTGTFSFHGATYTSPYISFETVEEQDNSYQTLEVPTSEQQNLETTYDKAPYMSGEAGGIPFIDFANQYMISGATYDPQVLQGKTRTQIAAELTDASSSVTKGVVGAANAITATICKITGNKPSNVCSNSAVQAIEAQLPTKVPTSS